MEPLTVISTIKLPDGRVFYKVHTIRQSLSAHRRRVERKLAKQFGWHVWTGEAWVTIDSVTWFFRRSRGAQ